MALIVPLQTTPPMANAATAPFVDDVAAAGINVGAVASFGVPCTADINGDSIDDLVIDRHRQGPWSVYTGTARGTYVNQPVPSSYAAGQRWPGRQRDAHSCVAGDVDGNGRVDLIASVGACTGTCTKTDDLWLNQGPAGWQLAPEFMGPSRQDRNRQGILVDLNGDGWLDYATVAARSGQASAHRVYWNQGRSGGRWLGFRQQEMGVSQGPSWCIVAADINGDGHLDVIVCDQGLRTFLGPTLTTSTRIAEDIGDAIELTTADLPGYAGTQLVVTRQSALEIRSLDGKIVHETWPLLSGADVAVLDLNGDGLDDLFVLQALSAQPQGSLGANFALIRSANLGWERHQVPQPPQGAGSHVVALKNYRGLGLDAALVLNGGINRVIGKWDRKGPRQVLVMTTTQPPPTTRPPTTQPPTTQPPPTPPSPRPPRP